MIKHAVIAAAVISAAMLAGVAEAGPITFSTGTPDGRMAMASRPGAAGEIETADDFLLSTHASMTDATFTGLIPLGSMASQIVVEIYRVFPSGSNVGRTSGAPLYSTSQVPTRVNSPGDVAFGARDSATAGLSFTTTTIASAFTAFNSITPGGIHAMPNQRTGGNGPVTGEEVEFSVHFATPLDLPADHYFFVPQVALDSGDFLWLSSAKPIAGGTGPFLPDLQAWTRDAALDPDWLRVGTDIVGGATPPTFNAVFSLSGNAISPPSVPEPATLALLAGALLLLRRRKRASAWVEGHQARP